MPIKVKDGLPAIGHLQQENIFVMTESRAVHQDIRPLKIVILNLMPEKQKTELHLLRRLSNSPLQVEVDLLHTETHESRNTPKEHLSAFYTTFSKIRQRKYDGLIITGAPVEQLEFEQVDYWDELRQVMEWSTHNVSSTLHLCWAAQAGLFHHYGVPKRPLAKKQFGIYEHTIRNKNCPLIRGFDDVFWAPHSRHTAVVEDDLARAPGIEVVSTSKEAGVYIIVSKDKKRVFITGHSEYDPYTLLQEYKRDMAKGLPIDFPENYFQDNDPGKHPLVRWNSHSSLLFSNWINYYVYQLTPYRLEDIA